MNWGEKLQLWKSGIVQTYPKNIKSRFFFETFVCDQNLKNRYQEKFITNKKLDNLEYNFTAYQEYIDQSKNQYVTSFYNLSGDSKLIIPIPKKGKKYTTIKEFIDTASLSQQKNFWKYAVQEIIESLKTNKKIYVSTHGLGIPYFHLRLDTRPKYYLTKEFIKID